MIREKKGRLTVRPWRDGSLDALSFHWVADAAGDCIPRFPFTPNGQLWAYEYSHRHTTAAGTYAVQLLDEYDNDYLTDFIALASLAVNTDGRGNLYQELSIDSRSFCAPPLWFVINCSASATTHGIFTLFTRPPGTL